MIDLILKLFLPCFVLSYISWHGILIKTGSFYYELYPIRRFFFKEECIKKQKELAEDIENIYTLMMSNKSLLRETDDYMEKVHSLEHALKLLNEQKKKWFE